MRKYWIELGSEDFKEYKAETQAYGGFNRLGYGVTATDYEDALSIISSVVFHDQDMPKVRRYIEDVAISDLDQNHVACNITASTFKRGIWYPGGLETIR